jgi:ribosomal protein S18 acetylase RimI-like enzyme
MGGTPARTGFLLINGAVFMELAPSDESTIRCMTIGLITRPATTADVPALVALVNSAYRGDSSKAGWTTEADLLGGQRVDVEGLTDTIARPGNVILLHERDQVPVACVHLERTGEDCYLGMLMIRPTTQGAGLGRQMLETAERWAMEHWSSRTMHMTVIVQRTELIAWYERRGYRRTGERKPFPYGDERFGLPQRDDLAFEVLRKSLSQ